MTTMLLSRPSLIIKNPGTLHTSNVPTPCRESCHHSQSVCSKTEKEDTPKQSGFEKDVCFCFLQESGLERTVLVTENMATRQIRAGQFCVLQRSHYALQTPDILLCRSVSICTAIEPRTAGLQQERRVCLPVILSSIHSPVVYAMIQQVLLCPPLHTSSSPYPVAYGQQTVHSNQSGEASVERSVRW